MSFLPTSLCSFCVILPSKVFSDCSKANDLSLYLCLPCLLPFFFFKEVVCLLPLCRENLQLWSDQSSAGCISEMSPDVKGPATADTIGNYCLDWEALKRLQLFW